jgi:ATP-binding cassette subfamily B protein
MNGIDPEAYDRSYSDRELVGRVIHYFRPVGWMMILVAILMIARSALNILLPVLIARGVSSVAATIDTDQQLPVQDTVIMIILILGVSVASWVFNFIQQRLSTRAIADVTLNLRTDAMDAVLALDMSFYDEFSSGKIVSRVTSDTESFSSVVTLTQSLISQLMLVIGIFVVFFSINTGLALVVLAIVPFVMAIALGFRRIARYSVQQSQRVSADINSLLQETISGISIAKNFRQEQRIYDEFTGLANRSFLIDLRTGFVFNSILPLLNLIAGLATVMLVYFGGWRVIDNSISMGDWFFFMQTIGTFWFPLTSIASYWSQFQLGLAASERVFALLDAEPMVIQHGNQPIHISEGVIEFRNVIFRYMADSTVLQGFNLNIASGETLAIVGHTGAGKSTIAKLIARFYEFQGGEILIDGQDIRSLDLQQYHRQLGIVSQIPFLFSGTVADNIRYARPDVTDAEIAKVAWNIAHGEWIETMANGLETEVDEEGRGISLGQRQLIALARVLIQDPAILILDEATANVDPLTEFQIQEALEDILHNRTSIVIAHRLSTVRNADRIIVLDQGQIVEEGTHDVLLAQAGQYAHLYNTYFRSQSVDYEPGSGFVPVRDEIQIGLHFSATS